MAPRLDSLANAQWPSGLTPVIINRLGPLNIYRQLKRGPPLKVINIARALVNLIYQVVVKLR